MLLSETVEPFRYRVNAARGLRDRLADVEPTRRGSDRTAIWPEMPDRITDRNADCWEPLLAVADAAGGGWSLSVPVWRLLRLLRTL